MSETINPTKIVWIEVCFERKPYEFQQLSSGTLKSRKPVSRKFIKPNNKCLIYTQYALAYHSLITPSSSKSTFKGSVFTRTCSKDSFSSYGMIQLEEQHISATNDLNSGSLLRMQNNISNIKCNHLSPVILKDLIMKPNPRELLERYVKDKIIKIKSSKDENNEYNVKKMYEKCITDCYVLNRFLSKDTSFLPDFLKDIIKQSIELKSSSTLLKIKDDGVNQKYPGECISEKETFNIQTGNGIRLFHPKKDITQILNNDNDEFRRLYNPLLLAKTFLIMPDNELVEIVSIQRILILLKDVTTSLLENANIPDAVSRKTILTILQSAKFNSQLLQELCLQVDQWYSALLNGLFSNYKTVVEDTCTVISFICFQPILANTIINNIYFDVGRDSVTAILRAIEYRPYWFKIFSFALSFIIGCCQKYSILEAIYEKVHTSKEAIILDKYTDFIFYASKFWKISNLMEKPFLSLKLVQFIEFCMYKRLSHHSAKRALVLYCRRCSIKCKSLTIWPGKV